jgi:hypothetical protein
MRRENYEKRSARTRTFRFICHCFVAHIFYLGFNFRPRRQRDTRRVMDARPDPAASPSHHHHSHHTRAHATTDKARGALGGDGRRRRTWRHHLQGLHHPAQQALAHRRRQGPLRRDVVRMRTPLLPSPSYPTTPIRPVRPNPVASLRFKVAWLDASLLLSNTPRLVCFALRRRASAW